MSFHTFIFDTCKIGLIRAAFYTYATFKAPVLLSHSYCKLYTAVYNIYPFVNKFVGVYLLTLKLNCLI